VLFFILDFRSADVDGAVVPGRLTLGTPTLDMLRECRNVVFLVHGFNVSRSDGSAGLRNLSGLLPVVGEGAAVAVLWPGDSMLGPTSYSFETNKADDSAVELAKFIGDNLPGCPSISFAAHSLGSRVVMQTVQQLKIMGVPVSQVCLMAGAIDNDSLAGEAAYLAAAQYADRVAVLYSPSDTVLQYAYPAGNLLSAFLHWTATSNAALGFTGPLAAPTDNQPIPQEVQATAIQKSAAVNHSDYIPNAVGPPSSKQMAAARYANLVLSGVAPLKYE
jgi:esterase/lipase superfamily enzyme